LAVRLTDRVGAMWCAYLLVALIGLPPGLKGAAKESSPGLLRKAL
jgi:hypothetical protein